MSILILLIIILSNLFIIGGALALIRFPDSISRLHATGKAGSFCVILLLILVFINNPSLYNFFKILLLSFLVYFTSSQAAQLIAKASYKN
jgi:multicomponent Na+:H+ antiporter subunit G